MLSVALLARPGLGAASTAAVGRTMAFLDYFTGVFTLLSLTAVVACGLAATDRLVLTPRLRVAVQSVHRASAVAALGFLGIHIAVKVVEGHAGPQTAVVPFTGGTAIAVSLGTIAADLLVLITATGVLRGRFAGHRPWLWRVLHSTAYVCWPVSLAHGLTAGREAHAWVFWGYGLCAALMALTLLVRSLAHLGRHRNRSRRRHHAKAYRPAAVRPATLSALSTRAPRPAAGARPIARPTAPQAATRRSAQSDGVTKQPKHALRPGPRPLRLSRPGSSE
ncbi:MULTISPECIES: hypothetical protein [Streptomyces]|uniref:hypothetical protein n=1 Tax=Streptomyces TaxID=1883 RepID=UPI0016044B62|nr:hypothetical protein [Streptomyces murinus]MBA9050332.1 hypothetical protein [Streptomyces murinus]